MARPRRNPSSQTEGDAYDCEQVDGQKKIQIRRNKARLSALLIQNPHTARRGGFPIYGHTGGFKAMESEP